MGRAAGILAAVITLLSGTFPFSAGADAPMRTSLPIMRAHGQSVDQPRVLEPGVVVKFNAPIRPLRRPVDPASAPVIASAEQVVGPAAIAVDALAAISQAPVTQPPALQMPSISSDAGIVSAPIQTAVIEPSPTIAEAALASVSRIPEVRPLPRPVVIPAAAAIAPRVANAVIAPTNGGSGPVATTPPVYRTQLPLRRPKGLKGPTPPPARVIAASASTRAKPSQAPVTKGREGRVCGDRRIRGRTMSPISGRIKGCGIANPVLVSEVAGVKLTRPATIDCTTAAALSDWVEKGVKPAVGRYGGGVSSLHVVASYSCRTRNNKAGAKLSEHAKGRAVDVAAINLKNGGQLDLLTDWRTKREGAMLKKMHKAACGPFGTVLGPNADRYHQDHFHMDTARYRSGSYCR